MDISIYNIRGKLVKEIVNEEIEAGYHILNWNGRNEENNPLPSGVYFYKMSAGKFSETQKMLLLR